VLHRVSFRTYAVYSVLTMPGQTVVICTGRLDGTPYFDSAAAADEVSGVALGAAASAANSQRNESKNPLSACLLAAYAH
jgi:hypothetical protein